MRITGLLVLFLMGIAIMFVAPPLANGQFGGGGGKKGGFGGGGGGFDAGSIFDRLANGRPSIPISELKFGKTQATQYAQDKGITNGMINRQQYIEFSEQLFKGGGKGGQQPGGGGPGGFGGGGKKGKKGGDFGGDASVSPSTTLTPGKPSFGAPAPINTDVINQLADASFKRLDANGDGRLTPEEMPPRLKFGIAKWDKNGDGLIDVFEYRDFFASQLGGGGGNEDQGTRGIASVIIEEEELDRKPVVFRAGGKMPAGLPAWFKDLDKDEDGQVALYEWRRGGKDIDDFKEWDLNDDGFITPDEAVRYLAKNRSASNSSSGDATTSSSTERPQMNGRGGNGDRPAFDFSKMGKGGFGGGKGKKGGGFGGGSQ